MTVLERYIALLNMSDKALMGMIDLYNNNQVSPKTRLAMEMIEGCDGDGDRVVGSDFQIGDAV